MSRETKNYFIAGAALLVLVAIYAFVKLPELAGKRHRELAELREITVTIPEGFSVKQIGEVLEGAGLFSRDEFIKIAQKEEGYLFPDTYRFFKKSRPEDIIAKMKRNFEAKFSPEVLDEIKDSGLGFEEIIIMASLLEEEVKSTEDRKIVAGILWKRLDQGIGLNVDATLTYVLGKASRELTQDDLKIDFSYNTYRYRGLPPTPISNPGMDTIFAALRPTKSPHFYYLTDKEGRAHYAATLEGHSLNKRKYLR